MGQPRSRLSPLGLCDWPKGRDNPSVSELPSGTVSLLFTDIEGSTQLQHRLGEQYHDVVAEHRRLLEQAFAEHSGVVVDRQTESFFVGFTRARYAVAAAAAAQRALAKHDWPDGVQVKVRMGIHSGDPEVGRLEQAAADDEHDHGAKAGAACRELRRGAIEAPRGSRATARRGNSEPGQIQQQRQRRLSSKRKLTDRRNVKTWSATARATRFRLNPFAAKR